MEDDLALLLDAAVAATECDDDDLDAIEDAFAGAEKVAFWQQDHGADGLALGLFEDIAEARAAFDRELGNPESLELATALNNLGDCCRRLRDWAAAERQ